MIKLRDEEINLQREVFELKASIAPIRKVPNEILGRIFVFHTSECFYKDFDPHGSVSRLKHNYALMAVCKLWCKTAITCPQLWTEHILGTRGSNNFDTHVKRAGSLPLNMLLKIPAQDEALTEVWKLVEPFIQRLRGVQVVEPLLPGYAYGSFDGSAVKTKNILATLARTPITQLSLFSVKLDFQTWETLHVGYPFEKLECLTIVRSNTVPSIIAPRLKTLVLVDCTVDALSLFNIVRSTNCLEVMCTPEVSFGYRSQQGPPLEISNVLKLRELRIGKSWTELSGIVFYTSLFKDLSLETLEIQFTGYIPQYVFERPAGAYDSLKSLTLKYKYESGNFEDALTWHEWLKSLNRLQELEVLDSNGDDYSDAGLLLNSLLHSDEDSQLVLPRLRRLKVVSGTYWPSIFLRIMAERSASQQDLIRYIRKEMDEEISLLDELHLAFQHITRFLHERLSSTLYSP